MHTGIHVHIVFVFRIYSYTHKLVLYGGFIHLYVSIDVEFMNAEEDKDQPDLKVLIIVDQNCSAVYQCLLTCVCKTACMGIVYLSFVLVSEPRQSHEETPKGTEGLLHNHL